MLFYYTIGSIILPYGDFGLMPELPKMFARCKNTEHHDMNIIDFFTDHLINIDCFFDAHDNDDEQKAHQPFDFQHQPMQQLFCCLLSPTTICLKMEKPILNKSVKKAFYPIHFLLAGYCASIFHPPVVA